MQSIGVLKVPESEQIRRALRTWLELRGVIERADRSRATTRRGS
jgi:hypothetical protein